MLRSHVAHVGIGVVLGQEQIQIAVLNDINACGDVAVSQRHHPGGIFGWGVPLDIVFLHALSRVLGGSGLDLDLVQDESKAQARCCQAQRSFDAPGYVHMDIDKLALLLNRVWQCKPSCATRIMQRRSAAVPAAG